LDSAYNRCAKIGGIFRMHNLIWSSQQPTWLKGLSDADQLTEINNWYKAVADHFAGKKNRLYRRSKLANSHPAYGQGYVWLYSWYR
jgi:GH35 family endo-1,4-beta-xylanase